MTSPFNPKRLIDRYGISITMFADGGKTYGSSAGIPDNASGGVAIKGYFYDPKSAGSAYQSSGLLDEGVVAGPEYQPRQLMISDPGFVPSITTRVRDKFGVTWTVIRPVNESACNVSAFYDLTVRQVNPAPGRMA